MMEKLQKIIRERMNISKILAMKVIKSLKQFELIEKGLKELFEIC